jgi:PadR family transcriptional regulator, regulatory protein PadR
MARASEDLLRGTLDALILKTLTWGPRHGYGIAGWIKDTSGDTLSVEDRALYLALHRLEDKGWVESDWGLSDNNRRAKFYQLTARGRAHPRAELSRLTRYADGLFWVLNAKSWGSR